MSDKSIIKNKHIELDEKQKLSVELKLKAARIFKTDTEQVDTIVDLKPIIQPLEFDSANFEELPEINEDIELKQAEQMFSPKVAKKGSSKKWFMGLATLVLLASVAELVIFVMQTIQQQNWLAGVWLIVFVGIFLFGIKSLWHELRGLKLLKRQQHNRVLSEQMFHSPTIGLAEQHCLQIAENLPKNYQTLVTKWRASLDPSYTDSEMLSLFEQQVLVPVDRLAVKTLTQNASAAGVMIAVSPFALLDMFIVLWRNIRMINQVSEIYGVRLGYWGRIKLIKNIFHTMVYAGAAEILSDAGNYALGAGITGKLSTRVAQGLGAGVLTTRIGLKAITECRPMPCLAVEKPSLSLITKQLFDDLKNKIS